MNIFSIVPNIALFSKMSLELDSSSRCFSKWLLVTFCTYWPGWTEFLVLTICDLMSLIENVPYKEWYYLWGHRKSLQLQSWLETQKHKNIKNKTLFFVKEKYTNKHKRLSSNRKTFLEKMPLVLYWWLRATHKESIQFNLL